MFDGAIQVDELGKIVVRELELAVFFKNEDSFLEVSVQCGDVMVRNLEVAGQEFVEDYCVVRIGVDDVMDIGAGNENWEVG